MHRRALTPEQLEARAANATAQLLMRSLIVPKIFFEAAWPNQRSRVDVLAIDRAGAGDIHIVEVKGDRFDVTKALQELMTVPAHYRYLAIIGRTSYRLADVLYAPTGFGRIGIIRVLEQEDVMRAQIEIPPERFRLESAIIKQMDRFVSKNTADLEVRP